MGAIGQVGDLMTEESSEGSLLLGKLPEPFQWVLHNLVAHPISEIAYLASRVAKSGESLGERLFQFSTWIHDATIPRESKDD